jgi:8-oxo-dGTP pyrophosphatase MutT (NUDIX family)
MQNFLRQTIFSEIESILPLDALEEVHRADAMAWVASCAELCRQAKPATPPKHLVSYFAVIQEQSMLLVDHKNAQLWLPSGGHVEPGEHPRETVLRELFEELGFETSHAIGPPLMITATKTVGLTSGHIDVSLWYLVRAERAQTIKYDEAEFNGVRWFDFSELPFERSDPHMRRFIEKVRSSQSTDHMPG